MVNDPIADWLTGVDQPAAVRRDAYNASQHFALSQRMAHQLGIGQPNVPVVTVAGTNGKGSCVTLLESIYLENGYRVAATTSPHLLRYNERVRLNGLPVKDQLLYDALNAVYRSFQTERLSPFTWLGLATLTIFLSAPVDIILLEVGLGGRYDPMNIIDAEVALITSIALDHCAILGETREAIALEKAGIIRKKCPVICGDRAPPHNLEALAKQQSAPFYQLGREFDIQPEGRGYRFTALNGEGMDLPRGGLFADNVASSLMVTQMLQGRLPVTQRSVSEGVSKASLIGRAQRLPGRPTRYVDVAHNVAAVERLITEMREPASKGETYALFGVLSDKSWPEMLALMQSFVQHWYVVPLAHPRSVGAGEMVSWLATQGVALSIHEYESPCTAYQAILEAAKPDDRVILFGSFHLIGALWPRITKERI